jgi:molybdopterin-guanine dinucleotide biosynthesis protein A
MWKGLESLCSMYGVSHTPHIEMTLSLGYLEADSFIASAKANMLDEDDLREDDPRMVSFRNVNRPDDVVFVMEAICS